MNSLFPATQVPQFILDDPEMGPTCNIIITQPRRISAMSVAERVASERCENLGQCIGYTVRLDSCCSTRTQCLFVTPGVLLRKLQSNPTLDGFTHIILDEVHERDRYSEFLMICLKDILSNKQTSLKVVLMSATLQTQELVDYWRGAGISANNEHNHPEQYYTAPTEVNIPGRTYDHYRNNYMAQLDKDLSKLMQSTTFTCNGRARI
jgi:ATP-dependent RNA helicase DHX57